MRALEHNICLKMFRRMFPQQGLLSVNEKIEIHFIFKANFGKSALFGLKKLIVYPTC